ncbi:MAG TPA: hypothetical protein VD866_20230 [Urbifossiella sp.]|nr:hypothetical protein [Urbifossiella sp.]
MRALIPVACVAVFAVFVRTAWDEVHTAITNVRSNPPVLPAPPPVVEEEPVEDNRVFEPGAALPPPARPGRRTQYADPRTPPPARVHPAERVINTP